MYLPVEVAYFTDIFTIETWAAASERDYRVSGFPAPTATRGGYFQSTFDAVTIGDVLACYVKAPAKRWVGAFRIESEMYLDEADAVWGYDEEGRVRFPARFRTSPILTLPVEEGLPVHETVGVLRCMNEKTWSGLFRRSLTRMPAEDGEKLLELIAQEREPVPVRIPRKRLRRRSVAVSTPPTAEAIEAATDERPSTPHRELVWKLIQLGKTLGCDIWVASDERGKSYEGQSFADHVLGEFPTVGLDPESRDLVRGIDVLWIRGRSVVAAFEVEATTSVYSGLLRMSDLVALQPNTSIDLFIVAPDERASKVRAEIARPTFESFDPPLRERCRYLSASSLDACVDRTKPPLNRHLNPSVIRDFAEEVSSVEA